MKVATENSIRALPPNSGDTMLDELILTKRALENLFESDEAQISKEESSNDMFKMSEVLEQIKQVETLNQKFDIYYSEYRPLADKLKAKYSDFLPHDIFRGITAHEKYMDGLRELIIVQGIMLIAFEEKDTVRQYGKLYTGMVKLSDLLEHYLPYFPQGLIEYVKNIALAFLHDSSLKPNRDNQDESIFDYLVGLKNTTRSILWQIEQQPKENLNRAMQIQKNRAAIDWAKARLEQIENLQKAK